MRFLNLSAICQHFIIGRQLGKAKRPFLGKQLGIFPLKSFSIALGLFTLLGIGVASADDDNRRRLSGELLIDFASNDKVPGEVTIQIPNLGRFGGLRVPRLVDDEIPFRGEEFTIDFTASSCFDSDGLGNAGVAYLILRDKRDGDNDRRIVLKANVLKDVSKCLQQQNTKRLHGSDPFVGNATTSDIAAMVVVLNELLPYNPEGSVSENEDALRRFFDIPKTHFLDWNKVRLSSPSLGPEKGQGADVIFHRKLSLRFREGEVIPQSQVLQ